MSEVPQLSTEQHLQLKQSAQSLHRRFRGIFSVETIERYMREALGRMVDAKITTWLPVLAERIVGDRLRAIAKLEHLIPGEKPHVVFLCVHNAGRSQMAAGWMRHLAGDAVEVFTGGSEPASQVNPAAVQAMAEVGVDISDQIPQPWTDDVVRAADAVITMGCGDACPIFPGKRYEDWDVADPAGLDVEAVRPIRDDLRRRVEELIASLNLPVATG